jgi:hypothetical protein
MAEITIYSSVYLEISRSGNIIVVCQGSIKEVMVGEISD